MLGFPTDLGDEHLIEREARFTRYRAELAGLRDWIPRSVVKRVSNNGVVRLDVEEAIKLSAVLAGSRIDLVKLASISFSTNETTVTQTAYARCNLNAAMTADDVVHDILVPLKFLLSLAIGQPTSIESVDVVLSDDGGPWPTELHDLGLWARSRIQPKPKNAHPYQFLIAGPRDDAAFERLLGAWFRLLERGRKAIALTFALWEAPPKYVELRFGATMHVLGLLVPVENSPTNGLPPSKKFTERPLCDRGGQIWCAC